MADLLCYSCIMDGAATDRACENNPAAVTTSSPTVKCPTKYCKIQRLEYLDPPGKQLCEVTIHSTSCLAGLIFYYRLGCW